MFSWCTLASIIIHSISKGGQIPNCVCFLGFVCFWIWCVSVRMVIWIGVRVYCYGTVWIDRSFYWAWAWKRLNVCQLIQAIHARSGWNAFMPKNVHNSYYLIPTFRVDFYLKKRKKILTQTHKIIHSHAATLYRSW